MSGVNKIVKALSAKRFREFMEVCDARQGLSLRGVVALAGEFGVRVSVTSARSFREGPLRRFQKQQEQMREAQRQLAELGASGSTEAMREVAEKIVAGEICQRLMEEKRHGMTDLERCSRMLMRLNFAAQSRQLEMEVQGSNRGRRKGEKPGC